MEQIVQIPLAELHPFKDHPFRVVDDERMQETVESVREYGVLVPAIVRPQEGGGYEIVSGHRRKRACELAGLETMPVIVRDLDDDEAVIIMVDSNLQRENILPSERARAYRMKMAAIKHQGERHDLTSRQIGTKLRADEQVAADSGESARTVQRFVRLNSLVPQLMDMVDEKKVAMSPAYELSFLRPEEQTQLIETMETCQSTPSLSQAQRLKKQSQQGQLTIEVMESIMSEEKKPPLDRSFTSDPHVAALLPGLNTPEERGNEILLILKLWRQIEKYLPRSYDTEQKGRAVIGFLEKLQKKRQQAQQQSR
ncbi:MAG: ParB/RepB/Spo0J family partition protein [Clostridia bacterium]|nr:ParB/RepB/Spo0J family partition protein [Clostridia bacterium]